MKKFTGQFRNTTWDPLLIVSQIVALQAVFYFGLGAVLALMSTLEGSSRSLDHLFKYQVAVSAVKFESTIPGNKLYLTFFFFLLRRSTYEISAESWSSQDSSRTRY